MTFDSLGDRMKQYEDAYRFKLPGRIPVIIRVDGKSFHQYTKTLQRPIDENLVEVMNLTAMELCKQVQGFQVAYVQSDEISLLLMNDQTLETSAWFDNNIQKMASVAASIAGATFTANSSKIWTPYFMSSATIKPAYFDGRIFLLPKEEVCNYFIWREQDATRNSIQMLARSLYSHKQCHDKNQSELQELIHQRGINWNDCPTSQKRGRCIIKQTTMMKAINHHSKQEEIVERSTWVIDNEIPIFSQDRDYINQYVYPEAKEAV